jgi:hypothetical protein
MAAVRGYVGFCYPSGLAIGVRGYRAQSGQVVGRGQVKRSQESGHLDRHEDLVVEVVPT